MIKKAFNAAYAVIAIVFIAWCLISYCEVAYKNLRPDPQYWEYNALVLFIEYATPIN